MNIPKMLIMNFNNWTGKPMRSHKHTIKAGLTVRVFDHFTVSVGPVDLLRRVIVVRSELLADVLGECHAYFFGKGYKFDGEAVDATGASNFYFSREIMNRAAERGQKS